MPEPTREDLLALAERALEHAGGAAQATVWWERQLSSRAGAAVTSEATSVEVAVLREGRVGIATTTDLDEDGLRTAARAAAHAAPDGPEMVSPLPEPAPGREHEGYDPEAATGAPLAVDGWTTWRAAAARTAIVSTRGVRAYEQRSFGELRVRRHGAPGRSLELSLTGPSPSDLDREALTREAERLLGEGDPSAPPEGETAAVLGPWAVAEILRRAALAFAGPNPPLRPQLGRRVAASAVNLSDSPRFAATLPRTYDAEGMPRLPLPLIQDGVAHRMVDPGSGHSQAPGGTGGHVPEHLVLVGGGATDLTELAGPIDQGVLIPSLSLHGAWVIGRRGSALAEGARMIRGGELAEPLPNLTVLFEPIELLGAVQALTGRQRTVPSPLQRSARTASATVAPAARVGGALYVAGPA
jgi:predicted Zn-dependent protease